MDHSSKPTPKSKGPRVLANTIKKQEKSLNSSGNTSFLKKYSQHYIQNLRSNNAKLAHSVAVERAKYANLYKRFIENEQLHMNQQVQFRTLSRNIKTGVKSLNDSVELMCTGISILTDVNDALNKLWPEPKETDSRQTSLINSNPSVDAYHPTVSGIVESRPIVPETATSQTQTSQIATSPRRELPSPRQCTAMPMVKGQVISKPTISLQRLDMPVNVSVNLPANASASAPMSVGFRKGNRPPLRPTKVTFVPNVYGPNRLSMVSEEVNDSREDSGNTSMEPSSPNRNSTLVSGHGNNNSLPASHVVLERIDTDLKLPMLPSFCETQEEQDQLTVVHFGSLGFSSTDNDTLPVFRKSSSPPKKPIKGKQNTTPSPSSSKSNSDSDEYETESSSEDEELALQIVESKKSYTERKRQLDSKEGTSWNYDDKGKYHGRPPKIKKSAKHSNPVVVLSSLQKSQDKLVQDNVSSLREQRARSSSEKVTSLSHQQHTKNLVSSSQSASSENGKIMRSSEEEVRNIEMNTTNLEDMSMSFTCVTETRKPILLACNNSEVSPERAQESSEEQQHSERKCFVTCRPRGRKPLPGKSDSLNRSHANLSPLSSPTRRGHSFMENNENSPPSTVLVQGEELGTVSSIPEDVAQLPNVVLERLPSNVISGNTYLPDSSDMATRQFLKSADAHSTHSQKRFKCLIANSVTSTADCNIKQPAEESKKMENKTELVNKARSKERRKMVEPPVSPKVPRKRKGAISSVPLKDSPVSHIDSHSSLSNSEANLLTVSKRSTSSGGGRSVSPNRKMKEPEIVEHASNTLKTKKRSAKSQKSLEAQHTGASSSSSIESFVPHEADPEGCVERPKRHAAPTNLKEPNCHVKMRRT